MSSLDDFLSREGGFTQPPNSILLPPFAGPADPRIYIGPDDSIALGLSQDAAIVLYFGENRAFIISVEQSGGPDVGQLHIWSVDNDAGTLFQYADCEHDVVAGKGKITLGADGITSNDTSSYIYGQDVEVYGGRNVQIKSGLIEIGPVTGLFETEVTVFDEPIWRWVNGNGITADSADTVGVNELTVITVPSFTYRANHVYKLEASGMIRVSVAPNNPIVRMRKTNTAGQQFQVSRPPCPIGATAFPAGFVGYFRVGAADVTAEIVLTITGTAAFTTRITGAVTSPFALDVYDGGDGTNRTWIPTLV